VKSSHFLVVESDASRAESVVSALAFLGYRPVIAGRSTMGEVEGWRGVYVGTVA